ncbi:hypothetical protein JAG27_000557 [Proteus mirabilis]|uniref:hypothetical protein n=1 Tax=Proteus sp. G2671 TaxID=2698883 RepID=UPI001929CF28|nr:hypothetical protein [Proteus sp. G2671]EGT0656866.1 hypothetical protein [Proteus mirabilis]NBM04357.1 hypothetical protein [Proteus sp. G2671]HDS8346402.1 hypothetical protein [Proteus mirabilis]HDT1953983.1 hypothetical protein [Proteus mirabilis]HDU8606717.1 hypothetical protein [Proteus mirabilis]
MKTKSTKMELVKFERNENLFLKEYNVTHNNETTKLEQKISIARDNFGKFEVDIEMDGFPRISDETEALLKYGEWLERLGIAIKREAKRAVKRGVQ